MAATAPAPPPARLAAVDGLRAVAALSVLAYHAWLYSLPRVTSGHRETTGDLIWHELRLGLVLFFVISGFLLYGPWVRACAARSARRPETFAYFVRRAARIVPAYWLCIVVSALVLWPIDGTPGVRLPEAVDLWKFFVFAQNFSEDTLLKLDAPMWTLAVEATFYVLLPLLGAFAVATRHRAGAVVVALLFGFVGFLYNLHYSDQSGLPATVSKVLPAMAPYFAAGMLCAVAAHGRRLGRTTMWVVLVTGIVLVVGDAWWAADEATRGSHDQKLRIWRDLPAAIGFGLIILAVTDAVRAPAALAARPVRWVGEVSYGLYLWHVPILLLLRHHGLLPRSAGWALAVALGPVLLAAWLSWRYVEAPAQRRARDWLAARASARG